MIPNIISQLFHTVRFLLSSPHVVLTGIQIILDLVLRYHTFFQFILYLSLTLNFLGLEYVLWGQWCCDFVVICPKLD